VTGDADDDLRLYADGAGGVAALHTFPLTPDSWYYFLLYVNTSENSLDGNHIYINGVGNDDSGNYFGVGSLTNVGPMRVAAYTAGVNAYGRNIAYLAMYARADWIQEGAAGPAEINTIQAARYAELIAP